MKLKNKKNKRRTASHCGQFQFHKPRSPNNWRRVWSGLSRRLSKTASLPEPRWSHALTLQPSITPLSTPPTADNPPPLIPPSNTPPAPPPAPDSTQLFSLFSYSSSSSSWSSCCRFILTFRGRLYHHLLLFLFFRSSFSFCVSYCISTQTASFTIPVLLCFLLFFVCLFILLLMQSH